MKPKVGDLLRAAEDMKVGLIDGETIVKVQKGATAFVAEVFEGGNQCEYETAYMLLHMPNGERSIWHESDVNEWHVCAEDLT